MDIFGVGGAELLLLAFLAGVILGPRRLAKLAREAGRVVSQIRALTTDLTRQLNREIELLDVAENTAPASAPSDKSEAGPAVSDEAAKLPDAYRRFRDDYPSEGQLDGLGSTAAAKGPPVAKTGS